MTAALKSVLEEMLRTRQLRPEGPPLRGEDLRHRPLATGVAAVDETLQGGLPRGQISELTGPASSGRTGLALSLAARTTGGGALAGWVDPADRFDPASAAASGVDLTRLLWLRGRSRAPSLVKAVQAASTLLGSGLFDVVVLDVAGVPSSEHRALPHTTWIRLQRSVEDAPSALLLLAESPLARSPRGVSLCLGPARPVWSGAHAGRLLRGLDTEARAGYLATRGAPFTLQAFA
jgi:hypothetical protein